MARYEGSCHCGRVAYEVEADLARTITCNCSYCQRRGSVLAFSPADQSAFAQQRGEAAVAWARRAGGPFEYRVDPELDHALFGVRSRRRTLQLVDDELLRCRRQDAALRTRPRGTGDAR